MTSIYPSNIVPENNLRLPDALTIKHGPADLLAPFVLEGDKLARRIGIRLRLRHDFSELVYINREQVARGSWFRLVDHLNPEYSDLTPENSYWISGENDQGEIVLTQAGRVYDWRDTDLETEAASMFYAGHDLGRRCIVTAKDAKLITGVVFVGGARWTRPDYRAVPPSRLLSRLGRAYALARWPIDWAFAFMAPVLVKKGVAAAYGYPHASHSLFFPGSPWGDLEVVLTSAAAVEAYADLANFLLTELSASASEESVSALKSSSSIFDDRVTKISSEGVLHGNNSLS
jgi:hypothetical protein